MNPFFGYAVSLLLLLWWANWSVQLDHRLGFYHDDEQARAHVKSCLRRSRRRRFLIVCLPWTLLLWGTVAVAYG